MDRDFWNGRRVFLTGHTGFKGSWLALWLQALGAETTGYSLPAPTDPSLFELARVSSGMTSIAGDIRDFESLKRTLAEKKPEVIIHLAAQSVVRYSYDNPLETYSTNVMGTANLLEAIRQLQLPCAVVNVTSDKCYENKNWVWGYRESDPLGGHDPYSNSKACAELVMSAFRESYFNPANAAQSRVVVASGRAGNVIGGGDWTQDQLVPDIMRAFIAGRPVRLRNPAAVRPWQFVLEPLRGYLVLAEHLSKRGFEFAESWNFGPVDGDAQPVSWIVKHIASLWGSGARSESDAGVHPHEAQLLKLDISKARSRLGWSPKMRLSQTMEWVVEWYKAYQDKKDIRETTEAQISRYENLPADGNF
ncbi:MAG TPA: CDP-glucose 4,6-dehydratase [Terriglobia bacterium]|nr:CDP-glucose 4,6-dehydratase [Terriglobia bacterium]